MNRYTVVGIYRDTEQPWVITLSDVLDGMMAARKAVGMIVDKSKDMEISNVGVLAVFVGDYDDVLRASGLLWWNEL